MKVFLDIAEVDEIRDLYTTGMVARVTTNPSIIANSGKALKRVIPEIDQAVDGAAIMVEVTADDTAGMVKEARVLTELGRNIIIKIPPTFPGLAAVKCLVAENIRCTVTLVMSPMQALMASIAGADYIAAFVGRLTDSGRLGEDVIREASDLFRQQDATTGIIAASVRDPRTVYTSFAAGADIVTVPTGVFRKLLTHPLTEQGLAKFEKDMQRIPAC